MFQNPSRKAFAVLIVTFLVLIAGSQLAMAQSSMGRIAGSVHDATGAIITGAKVTITNEATGAVYTSTSSSEGSFAAPQLNSGSYKVVVEKAGFTTAVYDNVKVDPGKEYSLVANMKVGSATETVEVSAGADLVNTTNAEVVETVSQQQMLNLPLNGRNPIELIRLQPGVPGILSRANTAINGGRPTWTTITQDGVNIQDNALRSNALDFVPSRPSIDSVGEFTVSTTNQGADAQGGSSSVKLVTPSGTNSFHGSAYEFNRNSAFGANSWFNKHVVPPAVATPRPFLNRNQFGGDLGGPIFRNKLFFYGYYEGFRQRQQASQTVQVPIAPDFLTGAFRYLPVGSPAGATPTVVNILTLRTVLPLDAQIKAIILDKLYPSSVANRPGTSLNSAGYNFVQGRATDRNQYGMRFDYALTDKHSFEGIYSWYKDKDDRPDIDGYTQPKPLGANQNKTKTLVGAWKWTVTPTLLNEFRGGEARAPSAFTAPESFGGVNLTTLFVTNPQVSFIGQGRETRTTNWVDNVSWVKGNHSTRFGFSYQRTRSANLTNFGKFPTATTSFASGLPSTATNQLQSSDFPFPISSTDLANANAQRALLAGIVSSVSQGYNVSSKTSGYVAGYPELRKWNYNDLNLYAQDSWRIKSNLTLTLGLKWDYWSPLSERGDLALLPVLASGQSIKDAMLAPNTVLDFAHGGFWQPDMNNFGPVLGFAWDPFKDGKTSIRGGYSTAWVNDEAIQLARQAVNNAGLSTTASSLTALAVPLASGLPIPTATFKVPRTFADQLATISPTAGAFGYKADMQTPQIHELNFSVQREVGHDIAVEVRYVATLGRDLARFIDVNQIKSGTDQPFIDDFNRARNNGFVCLAAGAGFNPNCALAGSQPLTLLPSFPGGGLLTNAAVRTLIQQGQVSGLADTYDQNLSTPGLKDFARARFLPNTGIFSANYVENGASTDYHAIQAEVRRRSKNGLFFQANYTFGKVLSNVGGLDVFHFDTPTDNARPDYERSRADFDVTHIFNSNVVYELPFGRGKRFGSDANGFLDRIIGGFQVSGIGKWQSGPPFSITSGRATFNRSARSGRNMASSILSKADIKGLLGVFQTPDGKVYWINPSVIAPNGTAIGPDTLSNTASSTNTFRQVFFNPIGTDLGNVSRLAFDGPSQYDVDLGITKRTRITERFNTEFRADMFNAFNGHVFNFGDQSINSSSFGRITSTNTNISGAGGGPRVVQFSLRLLF